MDQRSKSNLPDLPESNDKWWSKAIKYRIELKKKEKCDHYFEYRNGREIICKSCNIGYFLTGKEMVKDGKVEILGLD